MDSLKIKQGFDGERSLGCRLRVTQSRGVISSRVLEHGHGRLRYICDLGLCVSTCEEMSHDRGEETTTALDLLAFLHFNMDVNFGRALPSERKASVSWNDQ
jgi:hypothetical protein